jgi:hypothetical protein
VEKTSQIPGFSQAKFFLKPGLNLLKKGSNPEPNGTVF